MWTANCPALNDCICHRWRIAFFSLWLFYFRFALLVHYCITFVVCVSVSSATIYWYLFCVFVFENWTWIRVFFAFILTLAILFVANQTSRKDVWERERSKTMDVARAHWKQVRKGWILAKKRACKPQWNKMKTTKKSRHNKQCIEIVEPFAVCKRCSASPINPMNATKNILHLETVCIVLKRENFYNFIVLFVAHKNSNYNKNRYTNQMTSNHWNALSAAQSTNAKSTRAHTNFIAAQIFAICSQISEINRRTFSNAQSHTIRIQRKRKIVH